MHSKYTGKDSAVVYYNEHYKLIEPDCAAIIRYGHYDSLKFIFMRKFRDVSKKDTSLILAQGSYTKGGLRDGEFVIHYLNGKLQAKGRYKNGKNDGDWVFYYPNGQLKERSSFKDGNYNGQYETYNEDGSPIMVMKISGDKCQIINIWSGTGTKIIDNGNGDYVFYSLGLTWQGKILNGLPDGIWSFQVNDNVFGSEVFEKGRFIKGRNKSTLGDSRYDDKSRIRFVPDIPKLEFSNSEYLAPDPSTSCDGVDYSKNSKWYWRIFD